MSHFQNQYTAPEVTQTDPLGNPASRTDEYGNQIQPTRHETGHGIAAGLGTGGHHHHGLHRSGSSSSSSSSEDDGAGGRRKKKGLKEKVKEKLPGGHKDEQYQPQATSTTTPGQGHRKKGVMEKIKEKVPGGGHHNP